MITRLVGLAALIMLPVLANQAALAPGNSEASITRVQGERELLEFHYRGKPLLVYAYGTNQFKPYVKELYTLAGDNVLLDSPPDHLHHHGLMYGIRVNGINFWEERDQPGHEVPNGELREMRSRSAKPPRAGFSQIINWVSDKDAAAGEMSRALLVEERTITVTVDEEQREVALEWSSNFKLGQRVEQVQLTGASYHGLGLRLPESFNRIAKHFNSENASFPSGGTGDVTPARWSAVAGPTGAGEATVALFGRVSDGGAMPRFFTMVQPFTYLSVTQGLDKTALEYSKGDKFRLDYLLVAYPDKKDHDFLQKRYERWARRR